MTTIYKKLQDVRVELAAASLKKSGKNKFSGYDYFELGDFIPTAMSLMKKQGLCGVISYGLETASLSIHDTEANGEPVIITTPMSTAALKGCHEVQNLGAVQTYLRRYLWITALEITEHDALDIGADVDDNKTTPPPKTKMSPAKPAADKKVLSETDKQKLALWNEIVALHSAFNQADPGKVLTSPARKAEYVSYLLQCMGLDTDDYANGTKELNKQDITKLFAAFLELPAKGDA